MTFLSVLLALILEQKRALPFNNPVTGLLRYHALRIRQALDVGKSKYEAMAWLSVALPWTLAAALIYIALYRLHFLFALRGMLSFCISRSALENSVITSPIFSAR